MLDDEALPHQLAQNPAEALFGDVQDAQQIAHARLRMPADEMHDPVMGAAEPVFGENRIGLGGEVAIGEEQQFHPLPQLVLAQKQRIGK